MKPLKMNKRGGMFDVIVLLVVIFVMFLFFAGWVYGFGLLSGELTTLTSKPGELSNASSAARDTFGQINTALPALKWIALVIVIAMVMSIMLSNFLIKAHPAFLIVYILITIVGIVLAAYISNAYESILTASNPLTPTLQDFVAMNFIMLNLPVWAAIIGFIGAIFLFIGVVVDREQGGGVI